MISDMVNAGAVAVASAVSFSTAVVRHTHVEVVAHLVNMTVPQGFNVVNDGATLVHGRGCAPLIDDSKSASGCRPGTAP